MHLFCCLTEENVSRILPYTNFNNRAFNIISVLSVQKMEAHIFDYLH